MGVGLVAIYLGHLSPFFVIPLCIIAAIIFGASWSFVPAYLQAKRGSHIVITTIMFNFLAAALMTYLMVEILIEPGQQAPQSREFNENSWLPFMHEFLELFGLKIAASSFNFSFVIAIIACIFLWIFI